MHGSIVLAMFLSCLVAFGLEIEHLFSEDPSTNGALMVAKGRCKGSSCPELHGKSVELVGSMWPSICHRKVIVEETSGWYFFWLETNTSASLLPSLSDYRGMHGPEVGYLVAPKAGEIVVVSK
jgi:hypothetical protein